MPMSSGQTVTKHKQYGGQYVQGMIFGPWGKIRDILFSTRDDLYNVHMRKVS